MLQTFNAFKNIFSEKIIAWRPQNIVGNFVIAFRDLSESQLRTVSIPDDVMITGINNKNGMMYLRRSRNANS